MASIGYAFVAFEGATRLYCELLDLRPGAAEAGGDGGECGTWGVVAGVAGALADTLTRAQVRGAGRARGRGARARP
jgi:hypothetical protein